MKLNLLLLFCLFLAGLPSVAPGLAADSLTVLMDYHDVSETSSALLALDTSSSYVKRFTIGGSPNYKSNPSVPKTFPIYALRISADTTDDQEDNPDKNGILFECAMHPREWLTTESCLELAEYLVAHRTDTSSGVPELLQYAEVWIIPITTTAGRYIDDPNGGDPTQFYADPPASDGWRGNGDSRLCEWGVNVARNFSRGFNDDGATVFCSSSYRGFAPFSTSEANALRQFVENHNISLAVLLHSNAQQIWNQWGALDNAGERMIEEAARIWRQGWSLPADQARYDLARVELGGGNGQFSAWLSRESVRSGDESSEVVGPWGLNGDQPLAGDFDRDTLVDDVGSYRPSDHLWRYDHDHNGATDDTFGPWASATTYSPFAGDFDQDGRIDDVAVLRLSDVSYHIDLDHDGDSDRSYPACGLDDDIPVAIDSDRDGFVDDRVAFRPSDRLWYYDANLDCVSADLFPIGPWGLAGDLPVAGDFDRDGFVDDLAVFRPSNQIWYYDLDHDGDTDHTSGPWGVDGAIPVAGDFNADGFLDDVGLFDPATRIWRYDDYHNATLPAMDEGSLRAIQTILIELPFTGANYYGTIYENSSGDGSNSFHPSGGPVRDVIEDSFIPMALYLIRQARSPGCPTDDAGDAETAYCPAVDYGLAAARLLPSGADPFIAGSLVSVPAVWTSWSKVTPARLELLPGVYDLYYRAQNYSDAARSFKVSVEVQYAQCSHPADCTPITITTQQTTYTNVPPQAVRSGSFSLALHLPTGTAGWYQVSLRTSPTAGGSDDFPSNDRKVIRFQSTSGAWAYFPLVIR